MSHVLVVEDERHLAEGLRFNLEAEGYQVDVVDNGEAAVALITEQGKQVDIVVLDVMLPGISGFEVVAEMRRAGHFIPVLILTARGHSDDVLKGFESGADDYLTKPFDLSILIARIHGLLRRKAWLKPAEPQPVEPKPVENVYRFGGKAVFYDLLELRVREQSFPLTLMEMNVMRHLIQHEGKAVSRKAMLEQVWGLREDTDTRAIDNFIVRLCRYIEDDPTAPKHLLTVRGVGYRFVAAPGTAD